MSTKIIRILSEKKFSINGKSFVFPLHINKNRLWDHGIKLIFSSSLNSIFSDSDVIIISSKIAAENEWWKEENRDILFRFLENSKKNSDKVIWADLQDGTGTTHFEVLPYVDRYFKGFLLKDRSLYLRKYYGSRFFTDYYHNKFQVTDENPGEEHLNHIPERSELKKVKLSWNNSFYNFNYIGSILRKVTVKTKLYPYYYFRSMRKSNEKRTVFYNCRFNTKYSRNTISFPRTKIAELLKDKINTNAKRLNKYQYYRELKNSRVVFSPFGWGEVCYRDFEAFNTGATLVKPDCDHFDTWPNYYIKNRTYLPFKWDFSDFESLVISMPNKLNELISIANTAQKKYEHYLFSDFGKTEFCERFIQLIELED